MMHRVLPTELARGQTVIVYARWLLVLVGLLVAVWSPDSLPQLRIQVGVVLLVAIANFVMHAQILRRRLGEGDAEPRSDPGRQNLSGDQTTISLKRRDWRIHGLRQQRYRGYGDGQQGCSTIINEERTAQPDACGAGSSAVGPKGGRRSCATIRQFGR